MPSLFSNSNSSTPRFLNVSGLSRGKSSVPVVHVQDDLDDFLSSDLEMSFASTVSLNSPSRESNTLVPESPVPMDISPATSRIFKSNTIGPSPGRPRAYTSGARLFGRDMSNESTTTTPTGPPPSDLNSGTATGKKLPRAALPFEWTSGNADPPTPEPEYNTESTDAMDVDTSFSQETIAPSHDFSSPVSSSAATPITNFDALFYDSQSPARPSPTPHRRTRRSLSPEAVSRTSPDNYSSSPAPSSPSEGKFERILSGPLPSSKLDKPTLQGLGVADPSKRLKRPIFSALGPINSSSHGSGSLRDGEVPQSAGPVPPRRAFSAMLPPNLANAPDSPGDEGSSFEGPDQSSPAVQAFLKRQRPKTLRRCDGSENLRPSLRATQAALRATPVKQDSPKILNENSPSSRWLMPQFGDNESHGKILPCHRVKEDGLVRITPQTMDDLLDGVHDNKLAAYYVIDCRFDYEFNGGHIPGALNMNTTTALEEFLLGPNALKPKPSVSGDPANKTVLIFHCEFSAKRGPTFAKHLRSKDRAMNNHVYPKVHFPEIYILEGGYCGYFKKSALRCQPPGGYVRMDDPNHTTSRREDLDQFRKAKFGRTKSYAYGEGATGTGSAKIVAAQQQQKRNTAPGTTKGHPLFAPATAARGRRDGLTTLAENGSPGGHSEDEETDVGDSPCPPPTKAGGLAKKTRAPFKRAETLGPIRMAY